MYLFRIKPEYLVTVKSAEKKEHPPKNETDTQKNAWQHTETDRLEISVTSEMKIASKFIKH